jgi:hypothetical protein
MAPVTSSVHRDGLKVRADAYCPGQVRSVDGSPSLRLGAIRVPVKPGTAENSAQTAKKRGFGRPFQKGKSGNPGGRPKGLVRAIREQTDDGERTAPRELCGRLVTAAPMAGNGAKWRS